MLVAPPCSGFVGATASVGFVTGQVLGGVLVQYTSWRSIFLLNVPIGLGVALFAFRMITRDEARPRTLHLDLLGGGLATVATAALVLGVSEGTQLGWQNPLVVGA